jgi:hypothetical protein
MEPASPPVNALLMLVGKVEAGLIRLTKPLQGVGARQLD